MAISAYCPPTAIPDSRTEIKYSTRFPPLFFSTGALKKAAGAALFKSPEHREKIRRLAG